MNIWVQMEEFIGKECMYRPLYQGEMKTGVVKKIEELETCEGTNLKLATMDNGDVVGLSGCYFFKSSTAAETGGDLTKARHVPDATSEPIIMDWRDKIKIKCPNCGEIVDARGALRMFDGTSLICLFAGERTNLACISCETYFPVKLVGCFQFVVV